MFLYDKNSSDIYADAWGKIQLSQDGKRVTSFSPAEKATHVSVFIPEGVESIEGSSFYGCKKLTDIVLPKTLPSITV